MLRPFRVENLKGSEGVERSQEDKVVRLTAPTYDATISGNPRASLKYDDEEGDKVTVGSSLELVERLTEASTQAPRNPISKASATTRHLDGIGRLPEFHIEDQEDVQAVWKSLQLSSRLDHGTTITDANPEPGPVTASSSHNDNSHQLADYRKMYFNATNPPLLSRHTSGEPVKNFAKKSNEIPNSTNAKLTPEGRRQARSAGDRLRARGPPLQPGLATLAPSDRLSHHSRWASYQNGVTSNTFSAPEPSLSASDRQGHDFTMMMDSQMQSFAEPSSDGCGNEDIDLHKTPDKTLEGFAENCALMDIEKQGLATLDVPAMSQKPLLELFEAELSNKAKDQGNHDSASSSLLEAETQLRSFMSEDKPVDPVSSTGTKSPKESSQPESSKISSTSAPQLQIESCLCQDSPKPVEEAIRTTVTGFETCLRGLIDVLQAHDSSARPSAEITGNALLTIQKLAEVLTTPKMSNHQDSQDPLSEKAASPRPCSQEEVIKTPDSERRNATEPNPYQEGSTNKNGDSLKESDLGQEIRSSRSLEGSYPYSWRVKPKEAHLADEKRARHPKSALDLSGPFRYHGPGPIHLPPYSTRYSAKRASSLRHPPKVDDAGHLRRFQSTRFERKFQNQEDDTRPRTLAAKEFKAMNPFAFPAVTTRFPTVAQFERSNHLQNSSQQNLIDFDEIPEGARLQAAATISSPNVMHAAQGNHKGSKTIEEDGSYDAQEVTTRHAEALHSSPDRKGEHDRSSTSPIKQYFDRTAFDVDDSTQVAPEKGHEKSAFSNREPEATPQANHDVALNGSEDTVVRQSFNAPAVPIKTHGSEPFEDAEREPRAAPKSKQAIDPFSVGSDAARLNRPFNAFEPYPTNEVHPFSNVRRSATIADLRHAPSSRPRRPHSERYHLEYPVLPTGSEGTGDRQQRRPMRPLRNQWPPAGRSLPPAPFSAWNQTVSLPPPAPFSAHVQSHNPTANTTQTQESIQTQPHSLSSTGLEAEIGSCVKQLLDLGFGHLAQDRLLMYAEATKGDLFESLDMISEDQRAEDIRRSAELGYRA